MDTRPIDDAPRGRITCPKCSSPMTTTRVGEIEVDRCTSCGGLWLDALEKDKLITAHAAKKADVAAKHPAPHTRAKLHCPRDKSQLINMVDIEQPHVQYESCTVCGGMFLDAGELTDLSEFTLRERLKRVFG